MKTTTLTKFKTRVLTLVLTIAALAVGQSVWAEGLSGSGTQAAPYLINNVDDWNIFADVNNKDTYWAAGVYVKLNADVGPVSAKVGTSSANCFKGFFDGAGHTLTIALTFTTDKKYDQDAYCAPFRSVNNATIKRLHIAGTISTCYGNYVAGLVGQIFGNNNTNLIEECRSSVTITTTKGGSYHAGFVGEISAGATLNMVDCVFDGSIVKEGTGNRYYASGFVASSYQSIENFTNCLMAGSIGFDDNLYTFSKKTDATFSNCYYRTAYGTVQGTAVGEMSNDDLVATLGSGWKVEGGQVVPAMNAYNFHKATVSGIKSGYLKTGDNPVNVSFTVRNDNNAELTLGTHYTALLDNNAVASNSFSVSTLGDHTLVITGKSPYTGSKSISFNVTDQVNTWGALQEALNTGGNITLAGDVTAGANDSYLMVPGGVTATLDLNGHTINRGLNSAITDGFVMKLEGSTNNQANLTVVDTSEGESGTITGGNCMDRGGCVYIGSYASFTLNSGKITGNTVSSGIGNGFGGGVYMSNNTSCFYMNGGVISHNSAKNGGGIYKYSGSLSMTGGTVCNNTVTTNGGGIYHNYGSFIMNGGVISHNSGQLGGGVYMCSDFTMSGGTVTNNNCSNKGGGIYPNGGTFKISGSPTVSGNTKNTEANNVYLENNKVIVIDGTLTNTTPIGITMSNIGTFTSGLSGNGTVDNFSSDNDIYEVELDDNNEAKLQTVVTYDVNIADGITGGTVTANPTSSKGNLPVNLTITPETGYRLSSLTVKETDSQKAVRHECAGSLSNTASFTMPNATVTVSATFTQTMTADGGFFICMPKTGERNDEIPAGVTSLKLYDTGGPDFNYSPNCDGTLTLTAPENCKLMLSGTLWSSHNLYIYDSDGSTILWQGAGQGDISAAIIGETYSSGRSLKFDFPTNQYNGNKGLDITVTVIDCSNPLAITPAASITGGTFNAKVSDAVVTSAVPGTIVTLVGTPSDGYYLNDFIVTASNSSRVTVTDGTWLTNNTGTFRMPNDAVTVTPVFSNIPYVKMPKTGDKNMILPDNLTTIKIHDDGGPGGSNTEDNQPGNYSDNCNGNLILTAPAGHLIYLYGYKVGRVNEDPINVYDGDTESEDNRLCTLYGGSSTYSIYCTHAVNNKKEGDPIITSGQSIRINFTSNNSHNRSGLDLTAKVGHTITAATGLTGGSISADKSFASDGETISLTVTPATGYSIGTVSYNDGSDHVVNAVNDAYSFVIPANTNAYDISVTATFRKLLTNTDITIANIPSQEYTGSALTPVVSISDGTTPLVKNTDFSISTTASCINAGDYEVTITGIGNYDGTENKTFTITPASVALTANSDTKEYSGTEQTVSGFSSSVDGLTFTGVTASGSGTNVGNYDVSFSGVTLNATKDDTGNYVVTSTTNGTLTINPKVTDYGALDVSQDENGTTATIDGTATGTINITSDVTVDNVSLSRTFTANEAATLMLPFEIDVANTSGAAFYTYTGVTYNDTKQKWEATMTQVTSGTIAANTPYVVMPTGTSIDFNNTDPITLNTTGGGGQQTTNGDWTFKGTYEEKTWAPADVGNDYGFAATDGKATDGVTDVNAGDFVKIAAGAHIKPGRSYLTYTGGGNPFAAPKHRAGTELPQSISVILVSANGETTEISDALRLNDKGQMTNDNYYDLQGRKIEKPTKGLYIVNGRKVVVK